MRLRSTTAEGFKFRGIPVTTVAQTLIDLAARLDRDELARACHEADNSRYAWQQGHQRERDARARGEDFRRYTYADVFEHPVRMLAELREALAC